jgi:methionine-rich copper-binding protein CopC
MEADVSRAVIVLLGLIAASSATVALAHDGLGESVLITGTIQAINADRIQIETRDDASLQMKRVWVITTEKTTYKRGKARVEADTAQLTPASVSSLSPPVNTRKVIPCVCSRSRSI